MDEAEKKALEIKMKIIEAICKKEGIDLTGKVITISPSGDVKISQANPVSEN